MARRLVSMRLPSHTARRLKLLARRYGSQSNTVVELVDAAFACPKCGNRDMDYLTIDDETELVTCGRCGHTYDPMEG